MWKLKIKCWDQCLDRDVTKYYYFRTLQGAENNVFKIIYEKCILKCYKQMIKEFPFILKVEDDEDENDEEDESGSITRYLRFIHKYIDDNDVINYEYLYQRFERVVCIEYEIEEKEIKKNVKFYLDECDEYETPILK